MIDLLTFKVFFNLLCMKLPEFDIVSLLCICNLCSYINLIAGNGVDYKSGPYVVRFPAGIKEVKFNVSINDDEIVEEIESFTLTIAQILSNRVFRFNPSQATVYIVSDDREGIHNLC